MSMDATLGRDKGQTLATGHCLQKLHTESYLFKQRLLTRNLYFTTSCCCSNCLRFYQQYDPKVGQKGCFALSIEENVSRILNLSICISLREGTAEGKEIIFYISISYKFQTSTNSCSKSQHSINGL